MAAAPQRVVLADHSIWGVVGLMTFAQLQSVEKLICDDGLDGEAQQHLQEAIHELYLVRAAGEPFPESTAEA